MADELTGKPAPRPDRCETCRFWEDRRMVIDPASVVRNRLEIDPDCDRGRAQADAEGFAAEMATKGFCHRFPPQSVMWPETDDSDAELGYRFPTAESGDWCGEWKAADASE